jgi:hypothetical protein
MAFNMIQEFIAYKQDEEFLSEMNDKLKAINNVIIHKRSNLPSEYLATAESVGQLEELYNNTYSKMRDNLTKEIKCNY